MYFQPFKAPGQRKGEQFYYLDYINFLSDPGVYGIKAASELMNAIASLRQNEPGFAYNMACIDSDSGNTDDSLKWLGYAISQLGYDNISQARNDADLATLRAAKTSELAALTSVSTTFKVDPGVIWDDLDGTNNSPFALTNVIVTGTITSNGNSWPMEEKADIIKPGETHVWSSVLSIHNNTPADTSGLTVSCDQNK